MARAPRRGGLRLLGMAAGAAAMVLGGIIAAGLAAMSVLIAAVIGIAFAAVGGVLLYSWIVGGWLIYRTLRDHASPRQASAAERRSRSRAVASQSAGRLGASVLAVLAGLVLTVIAGAAIGGTGLPTAATLLLPPLIGAGLGLGVYALLRRWWASPEAGEWPPGREIRSQVSRIRRKASLLGREASKIGGVFSGLEWQAGEMARRAGDLSDRIFELRRVAREVRRDFARSREDEPDTARARLEELMLRNRRSQERCLTQLGRIERLLDLARLEISCPEHEAGERDPVEVAHDFETELGAVRQALEEVNRQIEM